MENVIDPTPNLSLSANRSRISASVLQQRLWWPLFAVVVLVGFLVTATGYKHGLPYVDLTDEMTIWSMGRAYMDPSWTLYQPQYPPGILMVSATIQRAQIFFGDPYINVAVTVEIMRFTSVIAFTIALALLMLLAWRVGGPKVGPAAAILAGIFWIALPTAVDQSKFATVDTWLSAWFIASVLTAFEGWHRKSLKWIAASLILAIIASIFKYQGAASLGMAGLACLTFWKTDKRRMIGAMVGYGVIVGIFGYWAIVIHKALEDGLYLPFAKTGRPTPDTILTNLQFHTAQMGPFLVYGVLPLVALILSFAVPSLRRRLNVEWPLWTLPILILAFEAILSFQGAPVFARHYLGGSTVLCVLAGLGGALLWQLAGQLGQRLRMPTVGYGLVAVLVVVIAVSLIPPAQQIYAMDADMLKPDTRAYFGEWARTTATAGPMLITNPKVAIAVQTIYGYRGRPIDTPYNVGTSIYPDGQHITQQMIDDKGIKYIVAEPNYDPKNLTTPLTRLISFDTDPTMRGDLWAAFYVGALPVYPPDKVVNFGNEVALRGMGLSKLTACPGDTLDIQMLWGAVNRPSRLYSTYVHLYSAMTGEINTPVGGPPVSTERSTVTWDRQDELLVGPTQKLPLATSLQPGDYQLWLGVFDPVAGTRLKLPNGSDHAVLTSLKLTSCVH